MITLDFQTLTDITSGTLTGVSASARRFSGVSIDTRTLKPEELFCAIRGERFDGHEFVSAALAGGAAGALVDQRATNLPTDAPLVVTPDTHQALIDLATWYRKEVGAKSVGITGSVGKTTVKEMVAHLLDDAGVQPYVSAGNLNNLYGLPLSLLRMERNTAYGVFELGISLPGEMSRLAPILTPDVAVITNVAAAHLETLGSLAGVRKEKMSLLNHLAAEAVAVLNAEDSEAGALAHSLGLKVVTFGAEDSTTADYRPADVTSDSSGQSISFTLANTRIDLPLFGAHHATNAACALAACQALGVTVNPQALAAFDLAGAALRGERRPVGSATFIMDCYNSSPLSLRAGFEAFVRMKAKSAAAKVAVLGDMLELGESSKEAHREVGMELGRSADVDSPLTIITVGDHARFIGEGARTENTDSAALAVIHVGTNEEAAHELQSLQVTEPPGALVYLKGSRGMALERIVTLLEERTAGAK